MNERWTKAMLDLAAAHAVRATGCVEPNPLVGAVIVREGASGSGGEVIAIGHHRVFGGVHAEVDAISRAAQLGRDVRGCTMYVTLEPCSHTGKQPPCTDAVIAAGITRVVCARRDPNPLASGGAEKLRAAGIAVEFTEVSPRAIELSEPFVGRLTSKLPWVIAKWAATIDGRLATSTSDSKWISGPRSRAKVQKLRSRVDAIVTGIGTVLVDDPELTCRDYPWRRGAAGRAGAANSGTAEQTGPLRVVLDAGLKLANQRHARLLTTLDQAPLLVLTAPGQETTSLAKRLTDAGASVAAVPLAGDGSRGLSFRAAMEHLRAQRGASTVLVEAGPTLLGSVLQGDEQGALADELHVFTGPLVIGHEDAMTLAGRRPVDRLGEASRWRVVDVRQLDDDVRVVYRRARGN